ncbi:bark storage protein A-like [Melia azedarach]|uniref:Bark storage protein A-like n=1 Tax=Melia azedarach TaxID=155640 RepID=A0ACC1YA62_MELAZ|nr:bark storage protein A-like [Melia azedarach]
MAAKQVLSYLVVLVFFSPLAIFASAKQSNRLKALRMIKELNHKGPYIGLITVFPPEEAAFFATEAFRPHPEHPFVDLSGRRFRLGKINGKKVIYVRCGVGMVNAAAATQQMLDLFDITGIIHFGIAGNVNNSMSIGDVTIPKQFAHTGIWDWLNPNAKLDPNYVAHLDIESYNIPKGHGSNLLGHIGYNSEQYFSESGDPDSAKPLLWAPISEHWLQVAANLQGITLEQCVNSTLCLPEKPKLVVGLRGSTANIFIDNAAYRNFLFKGHGISNFILIITYGSLISRSVIYYIFINKSIICLFI